MSEKNNKYKEILEDLRKNITDEKQLEYVNKKIAETSIVFLDIIDELTENFEYRINELEEQQAFVQGKLRKMQAIVNNIESDIYEDDFNLDILCPYCNNEFSTNMDGDTLKEVKCPECHNVIELDWNDDCSDDECGCSGHCHEHDDCDCDDCDCDENHDCGSHCHKKDEE